MSIDRYRVGLARREHIGMLPEIEREAAALFPDDVVTPEVRLGVVPPEQLESALGEERLWTAVTNTDTVVGFAACEDAFKPTPSWHGSTQAFGL